MKRIIKLCRGRGCCPEFRISGENGNRTLSSSEYIVSDDYKNELIFILDDFSVIYEQINKYLKEYPYYDEMPDDEQSDIEFVLKNKNMKMKPFQLKMLKEVMENVERNV